MQDGAEKSGRINVGMKTAIDPSRQEFSPVLKAFHGASASWTEPEHAIYIASMRRYYARLPVKDQPESWGAIQEALDERAAIQKASDDDFRDRRIFTRIP